MIERIREKLNPQNKLPLLGIVSALLFVFAQIPVIRMEGASTAFTLFDFTAPVMGALFGLPLGILAVLAVKLVSLVMAGSYTSASLITLFPVLFGVYYFARRRPSSALIGLAAVVLWNLHPIGRAAWQYSLFWVVPMTLQFISRKSVVTTALGATLTQHAIGGVLWLYTFGLSSSFWLGLIPNVAVERAVMGAGIALSYVAIQAFAHALKARYTIPGFVLAKSVVRVEE